jgi:hypothetical protein
MEGEPRFFFALPQCCCQRMLGGIAKPPGRSQRPAPGSFARRTRSSLSPSTMQAPPQGLGLFQYS